MRSRRSKGLWDQGGLRDIEIKGKWGYMRSRGTKGLWDQRDLRFQWKMVQGLTRAWLITLLMAGGKGGGIMKCV